MKHGHICLNCKPTIDLYVQDHLSLVEVGAVIGVSSTAVRAILIVHDVALRRRGAKRGIRVLWADDAVRAHQSGDILRIIAVRHKVSLERVRQVLRMKGVKTDRRKTHACSDTCRVVFEAPKPLMIPTLARQTGFSTESLRNKAIKHGLQTMSHAETVKHRCGEICHIVPKAFEAGDSIKQAFLKAGTPHSGSYGQRYRILHPEWPWPGPKWWLRNKHSMSATTEMTADHGDAQ